MTDAEDIRTRRKYAGLKRIMDRSSTLDYFVSKLGREPTATQVRLFIEYKNLVAEKSRVDRWLGERYLTDDDYARIKELGLCIASFRRLGKSVKILRDNHGRFVSSRILSIGI